MTEFECHFGKCLGIGLSLNCPCEYREEVPSAAQRRDTAHRRRIESEMAIDARTFGTGEQQDEAELDPLDPRRGAPGTPGVSRHGLWTSFAK